MQIVWAGTRLLGCGYTAEAGYQGNTRLNTKSYVCNYGPAGNYCGQPVFRAGAACSECGVGAACSSGLCTDNNTRPGTTTSTTTTTTTTTTLSTEKPYFPPTEKPKDKRDSILKKIIKAIISFLNNFVE